MTVQFDDARIKVTVDTDAAKAAVNDIKKSHGDLKKDRDQDKETDKKKKKDAKKAGRVGFLRARVQGGKARARAFMARQAGGLGPLGAIPQVALVAGAVIALQRFIAPLIAAPVAEAVKAIIPDAVASDEKIETMKKDILDTMDATIGEAVIQLTTSFKTLSSTTDFLKKVTLLAGEVPDIAEGWKFAKGVHGWNAHLSRMQQYGTRKMMEQYGEAFTNLQNHFGPSPQK